MRYLKSLVFIMSVIWVAGCEKSIDFDLAETEPKLVVEAVIENDEPPRVVITRSLNYFSTFNPAVLLNSFVRDARITISNGTVTHPLKEYAIQVGGGIQLFYYSIDSANLATAFKGTLKGQYTLRIETAGNTYTAQTTIPDTLTKIDSVWWKAPPSPADTGKAIIMARITDPPGYGNYGRYFTKQNNGSFLPGLNSVYDDLFIDGTTYEIPVEPGRDRNAQRQEGANLYNRGDTVVLKLSAVDKATYEFWRTLEYSNASVGNPFSTPIKISSNISNGALGYFGGYASQYRTVVIPR